MSPEGERKSKFIKNVKPCSPQYAPNPALASLITTQTHGAANSDAQGPRPDPSNALAEGTSCQPERCVALLLQRCQARQIASAAPVSALGGVAARFSP